jgi:hypothetical protein
VYDCNKILINLFNSINKVSESLNIPPTTLSRYIKSGKLYENTFYFYNNHNDSNSINVAINITLVLLRTTSEGYASFLIKRINIRKYEK